MAKPIDRLRSDLQARGLIDAQYRLTEQGNEYCARLLADLPQRQAYNDPTRKGRKWDMRWTHRRRAQGIDKPVK